MLVRVSLVDRSAEVTFTFEEEDVQSLEELATFPEHIQMLQTSIYNMGMVRWKMQIVEEIVEI